MVYAFKNIHEVVRHCCNLFNDTNYPFRESTTGEIVRLCTIKDIVLNEREGCSADLFLVDSKAVIHAMYDDGVKEPIFFPVLENIDLLRAYRKLCGMSRAECADFLRVPGKTLESWEQGRHKPPSYCVSFLIYRLQCRAAGVSCYGARSAVIVR